MLERNPIKATEKRRPAPRQASLSVSPSTPRSASAPAAAVPPTDTRSRILQAAEALFAEHGFDAVSMRDITATAKVNLAAINYHFGSKAALLAEVVAGRAHALVDDRLRLLAALRASARNGRPRLEAVIEAFLRPALEMSLQPGGAHHMRLRARLSVERVGMSRSQFEQIFDVSNNAFVDALAQALPGYPRGEVYWGFHCALGIMNYTMANSGRIQHLSDGTCDPSDVEATLRHLVPFIAQGLRALGKPR